MTEHDWLLFAEPRAMLEFVRGRVSDRKLRLFAVACCRRTQDLFGGDGDGRALDVVERFADGLAGPADLGAVPAQTAAPAVAHAASSRAAAGNAAAAASAVRAAASGDPAHPKGQGDYYAAEAGEKRAQCRLLRDLCGNPFHPPPGHPGWVTADVVGLARGIYEEKAFDRLPPLADALMDAGCADEQVLGH